MNVDALVAPRQSIQISKMVVSLHQSTNITTISSAPTTRKNSTSTTPHSPSCFQILSASLTSPTQWTHSKWYLFLSKTRSSNKVKSSGAASAQTPLSGLAWHYVFIVRSL